MGSRLSTVTVWTCLILSDTLTKIMLTKYILSFLFLLDISTGQSWLGGWRGGGNIRGLSLGRVFRTPISEPEPTIKRLSNPYRIPIPEPEPEPEPLKNRLSRRISTRTLNRNQFLRQNRVSQNVIRTSTTTSTTTTGTPLVAERMSNILKLLEESFPDAKPVGKDVADDSTVGDSKSWTVDADMFEIVPAVPNLDFDEYVDNDDTVSLIQPFISVPAVPDDIINQSDTDRQPKRINENESLKTPKKCFSECQKQFCLGINQDAKIECDGKCANLCN